MKDTKYKRIVLKIGTHVITKDNGKLDLAVMNNIVKQVQQLKRHGIEVIIVSSGAMGAGREILKDLHVKDDISKRQVLAAVGQAELMSVYKKLFVGKIICAQVLATREDFKDARHYANMNNCFTALLRQGIIPIVNENDVVAIDELMFTDNDELAGLIATMVKADAVLLLSVVDGVYNSLGEVIKIVDKTTEWRPNVKSEKSMFGRGGMNTKCAVAVRLASMGITTHIINGKSSNIIVNLILNNSEVGTKFVVQRQEKVSGIRRRLGFSRDQEHGEIFIDKRAEEILLSGKVVSLLPVGIIKVIGDFKKGDLIKIKNQHGVAIGLGVAKYDSKKANEYKGKKQKKELVHYNYLFIQAAQL